MAVGTTTVENLLRVARSDAGAGTAFAAFHVGGGVPHIVSVPAAGSGEGLSTGELAELVRQASADPEFAAARVFVRSVPLGRGLTLAVAPLRGGAVDMAGNMIGLVAEPDRRFEPAQLEVLEQLAERLLRHIQVVKQLNGAAGPEHEEEAGEGEGQRSGRRDRADVARYDDRPTGSAGSSGPARATGPIEPNRSPGAARAVDDAADGADGVDDESVWGERSEVLPFAPAAGLPRLPAPRFPPDARRDFGPFPDDRDAPSPAMWWGEPDKLTDLPSLAQFFSRAGRLLVPDGRPPGSGGAFAIVVLEVPEERTTPNAARVLTGELRFSDPVARVDRRVLAAALQLFPSGGGDAVEARLGAAVRSALDRPSGVRTAHVVAEPGDRRDVDELLREAILRLRPH